MGGQGVVSAMLIHHRAIQLQVLSVHSVPWLASRDRPPTWPWKPLWVISCRDWTRACLVSLLVCAACQVDSMYGLLTRQDENALGAWQQKAMRAAGVDLLLKFWCEGLDAGCWTIQSQQKSTRMPPDYDLASADDLRGIFWTLGGCLSRSSNGKAKSFRNVLFGLGP